MGDSLSTVASCAICAAFSSALFSLPRTTVMYFMVASLERLDSTYMTGIEA